MITSPTSCPGRRLQLLVVVVRNRGHAPGAAFRATPHSAISLAATNEAPRLAHLLAGHRVRPREILLVADSVVRMSSKSCSEMSRQNVGDELESGNGGRDKETNICNILDRSEARSPRSIGKPSLSGLGSHSCALIGCCESNDLPKYVVRDDRGTYFSTKRLR